MKQLIFALTFLAIFLKQTSTKIQRESFKFVPTTNMTALGGDNVIFMEDTSRRGNQVACSFTCSDLEACRAILYKNEHCILIGNTALPGVQDKDIGDGEVYVKKFFEEKQLATLATSKHKQIDFQFFSLFI